MNINLIELAEHYNQLIMSSDHGVTLDLNDTPSKSLFKRHHFKNQLQNQLQAYQQQIDEKNPLSIEMLASLARLIVNAQYFHDGNHRTALMLCFHLMLFYNSTLTRIHPYLLYAAIDFEYLKSIHNLNNNNRSFFSSNAIAIALEIRGKSIIKTDETKQKYLEKYIEELKLMPEQLNNLATKQNSAKSNTGGKLQIKFFKQFAGFRPTMAHSTQIDKNNYLACLNSQQLLDASFLDTLAAHQDNYLNKKGNRS